MSDGAKRVGNAVSRFQFGGVALSIAYAQGVHGIALLACDGDDDGGIHATGKEDDGFFHYGCCSWNGLKADMTDSAPRFVIPQQFVQLHLETYRQAVGNNPFSELTRLQRALHRREE